MKQHRIPTFHALGPTGRRLAAPLLALAVTGCVNGAGLPAAADYAAEIVSLGEAEGPPDGPVEACWQSDSRAVAVAPPPADPAPAEGEADAAPAATETIWFRAPCPAELTPEVIATLQRALAVRALYGGEVTGEIDEQTRAAIRAWQSARGLDSGQLSLAAARDLGLVAIATEDL